MMALYSLALALGLLLSSPWWLLRLLTTERYREGLGERLGRVPARLRQAVAGKRVVWVHAVSVGEVLAASRLVGELEAALGEGWRLVVSTTTRTGQALARERFGAERVFYFPLDFAWAVRAYLRALQPAGLVLMESELWPRLLHECEGSEVPVAVVNARVSDRSFARAMRVRGVWRRVLRKVSLWLMQSDEDARRIAAMGAREDDVHVGGNLKYDVRASAESAVVSMLRTVVDGRPLVVAGSTTAAASDDNATGEEEQIVGAWRAILEMVPNAVLVIAPRHPERFERTAASMVELRTVRVSAWVRNPELVQAQRGGVQAICLDTIGDLAGVYGLADVAFVGGSLVPRGGHNPLEPAQFGIPVVIGPSFENFRDIVERMKTADAIRVLNNGAELSSAVTTFLTDKAAARAVGERGRQVFEQQGGATTRAVDAIVRLIQTQGAAR